MKRKDLEAMDLSKEIIDKIMEMNGDDIEELKKSEGDLKLKISALEADNVSLNDTVKSMAEKGNIDDVRAEYEQKIAAKEQENFEYIFSRELSDLKPKSKYISTGIKAELNFTVEDYKKHGIDELKKRLTEIKQNSPDDFISEQPPKKINGSTSGGIPKGDITKADFTKMTSEQKIEFKESNPEKFREFLNSK